MKSEHRHELQTNELGRLADRAVPFFERYGNQITAVICGAAIIGSLTIYFVRRSNNRETAAWQDMWLSSSAEEFAQVAEDRKNTRAGEWARLREAEARLSNGIQLMFTDRETALAQLKQCQVALDEVLKDKSPLIRERALFTQARYEETVSDGDTAKAVATYKTLLAEFPETVYRPLVEERLRKLQSPQAHDFYAWFWQQKPKAAPPPKKPGDRGSDMEGEDDISRDLPESSNPSDDPDLKRPLTTGEERGGRPLLQAPGARSGNESVPAAPSTSAPAEQGTETPPSGKDAPPPSGPTAEPTTPAPSAPSAPPSETPAAPPPKP